jgi:hypothetical protein
MHFINALFGKYPRALRALGYQSNKAISEVHYEIAQFLIGLGAITEMLGANYLIRNCKLPRHAGVQ